MAWHRPKANQQAHRKPNELWWDMLDADTQVVMQGVSHIKGWLLRLDDENRVSIRYVARSEDGSVRAEFDTIEEAKDFLWAIVNMEKSND
jgi:hypothetical protein